MTRRTTHPFHRAVVAVAILAVMALLGSACHLVQRPGEYPPDPTGVLESVRGGRGTVTVTGWATQWDLFVDGVDTDRPVADDRGPILIAVLVDGEWARGLFPADDPRPDVDRYLVSRLMWSLRQKAMGYGFEITVPAERGKTGVCVAALNQYPVPGPFGLGDHVLLGCRTVTVS